MAVSAPEIDTGIVHPPMANVSSSLSFNYSANDTVKDMLLAAYEKKAYEDRCEVDLVERRCWPFRDNQTANTGPPATYEVGNVAGHAHGVVLPRYTEHKGPERFTQPVGNLGLYVTFFLLVISSQAMVAVPFNALVADKSHPSQRGFNSGMMGAMILLGNVSGALAGTTFTRIGVLTIYAIMIGIVVTSVLITVFSITETYVKQTELEPLSFKVVFIGFWKPLKDHDFRWVFITRFLMQQGVATITGFLEYWLNDMVALPYCWTAATSVALLLLPLLFAAAISSLVFGIVSDNTGYRKIIVALAAFTMAIGAFINAFLSGTYAYFIAAVMAFIIGLGFGAYQSVDFALVMDVLAEDADKAKDIAVWHQSLVLPQALATPLGGVVLDLFEKVNCRIGLGYIILFMMTSLYFVLSGIFVFKIRRPR